MWSDQCLLKPYIHAQIGKIRPISLSKCMKIFLRSPCNTVYHSRKVMCSTISANIRKLNISLTEHSTQVEQHNHMDETPRLFTIVRRFKQAVQILPTTSTYSGGVNDQGPTQCRVTSCLSYKPRTAVPYGLITKVSKVI